MHPQDIAPRLSRMVCKGEERFYLALGGVWKDGKFQRSGTHHHPEGRSYQDRLLCEPVHKDALSRVRDYLEGRKIHRQSSQMLETVLFVRTEVRRRKFQQDHVRFDKYA